VGHAWNTQHWHLKDKEALEWQYFASACFFMLHVDEAADNIGRRVKKCIY